MQVAQRGTATLTAAYQFGSCDRWQFICSGGTSISGTIFQNTFNAYSTNYSGGVQSASWTNGQFYAQQRIEAKNCFDLNNKTITVSARVYQDTGGTRSFDFVLVKATAVDNWTSQTTIAILSAGSAATAAPTLLSASYTLGATDASNGIALLIRDNATNTVVSKSYQIGDVQLEVGSVATPFEQRPYGMELALCQRYFQSLLIGGYGTNNAATVISRVTWPLFVAMRANPTIAVLSGTPSFFQGLNTANHSSIGATYITSTTAQADINVTGGSATAGLASIQKADGGIYSASAEL
jgi:hypothetical protein